MKLPILMSVPHAGLRVPPEVRPLCCLRPSDLAADGDEGAAEIYDLAEHVARFVTTDVARAIVDLNRAPEDRGPDGVVKTRTCWNVPVYREPLPDDVVGQLLKRYYHPYHRRLSDPAISGIRLGVDCHTMAAVGPPVGPDPGRRRPAVCLGDAHGDSLPAGWTGLLEGSFRDQFRELEVTVNRPFAGGYITRTHRHRRPWLQIELSRAPLLPNHEKRRRVLAALAQFCERIA